MFVCIFVKPFVPGTVNTRLEPGVGREGAAALARAFFLDTLALVVSRPWATPIIATTGPLPDDLSLPPDLEVWRQEGADLGARLEGVLRRALWGAPRVLAIGTDSPGLPHEHLDEAFRCLTERDAVLGPTSDGGFYTLGLRACPEGLLRDLPWSAPTTFAATKARLEHAGFTVGEAPAFFDVDRPEDLGRLRAELAAGRVHAPHTARALAELPPRSHL